MCVVVPTWFRWASINWLMRLFISSTSPVVAVPVNHLSASPMKAKGARFRLWLTSCDPSEEVG